MEFPRMKSGSRYLDGEECRGRAAFEDVEQQAQEAMHDRPDEGHRDIGAHVGQKKVRQWLGAR